MSQFFSFNDLKAGQMLKVKGKLDDGGKFVAMEISLKEEADDAAIEGRVQSIDPQNNELRIFNQAIAVPASVEFKGLQDKNLRLKGLKAGEVVKLKGKYSNTGGFKVDKIKIKDAMGFNVEELQGVIDKIDYETKTLDMVGLTVTVNQRTAIEGL